MRLALALALFLLAASPAAAHFHESLAADPHALAFRWASGTLLVEEAFEVRNVGPEPFGGSVHAWLPPPAEVSLFGPPGAEPLVHGSGIVQYSLGDRGLTLAPNATLAFNLTWTAPLGAGEGLDRRIVYATQGLGIAVEPPLVLAARPSGPAAGFADIVRVALPAGPGVEGWHVLAAFTVLLLAGAWLWDRRRGAGGAQR